MNVKKEEMKKCLVDIDDQLILLRSANDLLAATGMANERGELGQDALFALMKLYETITEELEDGIYTLQDFFEKEDGRE